MSSSTDQTAQHQRPLVWVVVLGDFGRSPRMQYHAASLSAHGYNVAVLASSPSTPPIPALQRDPHVKLHLLPQPPAWAAGLPGPAGLAAKAALQAAAMLDAALRALPRPAAILMQNPPAIPVMAVLAAAAARHRAPLVIDWHNLAYSVLALKHGRRRWLIALAKAYERAFGRAAAAHFCVTRAMAAFLRREFGVAPAVLYDRPPPAFRRLPLGERAALLERLTPQLRASALGAAGVAAGDRLWRPQRDAATGGGGGDSSSTAARPAIVVSSTSWTPDEDFGILLAAAVAYDKAAAGARTAPPLPDVLFVITGRGPQRDEYLARIRALRLARCAFASVWLEPEDYPKLLGAADLGVCLHTSSSGLDLPMKVVDMFGAGLPVCAARFDCIGELVADGETGLLFDDAAGLSAHLQRLLTGFGGGDESSSSSSELARMRDAVARAHDGWRWDANWRSVAGPVIAAACSGGGAKAAAEAAAAVASRFEEERQRRQRQR